MSCYLFAQQYNVRVLSFKSSAR